MVHHKVLPFSVFCRKGVKESFAHTAVNKAEKIICVMIGEVTRIKKEMKKQK